MSHTKVIFAIVAALLLIFCSEVFAQGLTTVGTQPAVSDQQALSAQQALGDEKALSEPPAAVPADAVLKEDPTALTAEGTSTGENAPPAFNVEPLTDENLPQVLKEAAQPKLTPEEASRYTLGATDVVEISVMRHQEVSGQYIINNEGKIQYEFVGDITLSGLTKDEAAELIKKRLTEYIIAPEVTVKITGYNSKVVYVVGEVYSPGKIYMRGDTIPVREALVQAGLPMLTGVTKKSKLITPAEDGRAAKRDVNVYALLYEGDLRENFVMKPGDVLYIPPTFLTKTMRALQPIAAPIGTAAGTGRTLATGF